MKKNQFETQCVHEGQLKDTLYKGAISPLYMATAYPAKRPTVILAILTPPTKLV